jgi:ATP-dependent exoDNAse (exonuclease V) alpha subunit
MVYNEGQKEGIKKLNKFIESDRKIFVLTGGAGTGKTTILKTLSNNSKYLTIYGATISHQAKSILANSIGKKNVYTIASLLGIKLNEETGEFKKDLKTVPNIKYIKSGILIIDECSMINQSLMDEIIDQSFHKLKIIFVGDINQIPPIGEEHSLSPTFEAYSNPNDYHQLTQIMRYDDSIANIGAEIIKGINGGEVNIDRTTKNNVHFKVDLDETLDMFVEDFKKSPLSTKCITYNNHKNRNPLSVYSLNKLIRKKLYPDTTELITVGDIFTLYAPFSDVDDEIMAQNSESFRVLDFKKHPKHIFVNIKSIKMGVRTFETIYKNSYIANVQFEDGRKQELHLVLDGKLKEDLDKYIKLTDWQMYFSILKEIPVIQYGYCLTVHKCQGSGFDNVYVFEDNIMNSPQTNENKYRTLYTAVTRSKNKLVINSFNNGN